MCSIIKTRLYKYYTELVLITDITLKFIKDNDLIVQGGMAINFALQERDHDGIYRQDEIVDVDMLSMNFYDDSNRLALELSKHVTGIDCIGGMHPRTRRIRHNFHPIVDITYVAREPPSIRSTRHGIRFMTPMQLRVSIYIVLSEPCTHALHEEIVTRFDKDSKRLALLDKYWPITLQPLSDSSLVTISVDTKRFPPASEVAYTGIYAYALYYNRASNRSDAVPVSISNDNSITIPANYSKYFIVSFYDYIKKYKTKPDAIKVNQHYDALPKSVRYDNNSFEVFDISLVHRTYHEIDNYRIVSIYNVMLYFATMYDITNDDIFLYMLRSTQLLRENNIANDPIFDTAYKSYGDIIENYGSQRDNYNFAIKKKEFKSLPNYFPDDNPTPALGNIADIKRLRNITRY